MDRKRSSATIVAICLVAAVLIPSSPALYAQSFSTIPIGEAQGAVTNTDNGRTFASPKVGQTVQIQGVIYQKALARTSTGGSQHSFFIQNTSETADGDPLTSDGLFVFLGSSPSMAILGTSDRYTPQVGDEVVLRGRITEFFGLTQMSTSGGVTLVRVGSVVRTGVNVDAVLPPYEANPPSLLAEADRFWERREGMRGKVPANSMVIGGRNVFASTLDGEVWVIRADSAVVQRRNPFARHVFRDAHPLDNIPGQLFDDGNGFRILMGSLGIKATAADNTVLIAPARTFDRMAGEAVGGTYFAFNKYSIQVAQQVTLLPGRPDPARNAPPRRFSRGRNYLIGSYNVENLYDFRNDPTDGCDFVGDPGCPGVNPPFDYVPASELAYQTRLGHIATQIRTDLRLPDILLVQEVEEQDMCRVSDTLPRSLNCGTGQADTRPDTVQELALAIAAQGGPSYEAVYDRDGGDDRGITAAYLYRPDRVEVLPAQADNPILGSNPTVQYRGAPLAFNGDIQNPKVLNAVLPADVDRSTGTDGNNVFTRPPQVGLFRIWRGAIGASVFTDLYILNNHQSSTPNARVGQRKEQAAYNAAIVTAILAANSRGRVLVGGDLNVFPRPDDPFTPGHPLFPTDQLAALYDMGLVCLCDRVLAASPASQFSFIFEGQAQTLDMDFVSPGLLEDFVQAAVAHINADFPADHEGDGPRGVADHDPHLARFWATTPDALAALVRFYRSTGAITSDQTAANLIDRIERARRFAASKQLRAARREIAAFKERVEDLTPRFISRTAGRVLEDEARFLIDAGPLSGDDDDDDDDDKDND